MPIVVALGTSSAIAHQSREHAYLLVDGDDEAFLLDCAGSPIQRLLSLGIPLEKLEGLILTHHHPDHTYGVPALLSGLWLHGRQRPFHVYGHEKSLRLVQAMGDLFEWETWPNWLPIVYHEIAVEEEVPAAISEEFSFTTSPGSHGDTASLAVRVQSRLTGRRVVYSSDTEPSSRVARLAHGAQLLIHEASGGGGGHSSAAGAGAVAFQAQVERLVLIHYPWVEDEATMLQQASQAFSGPVDLATDFSVFPF
jgi:ribonuclease Z